MGQGLISQDIIKQVKEHIDIVDVVSGYVALTKTGQNWKGLCPFHAEKTPSFTVSAVRQMFHCFGCGAGGDVFAFVMKRENVGFVESVQELSRLAGLKIETILPDRSAERSGEKKQLYSINEQAAAWFYDNLQSTAAGKQAKTYLLKRGLSEETIATFRLGYSLPSWDGLLRGLGKKGITAKALSMAGLAVQKERAQGGVVSDSSYYDRFRGRIMFPIWNTHKQVIAFGGRVLDDGLPKYLNSSDSLIFKKGMTLYGLERAREASGATQSMIIVEGYFDVIALSQAGIRNVVATLGTALTAEHIQSLQRLVSKIVLLFDADAAGVRAAVRTLDLFQGRDLAVRVVSLPNGEDPDSFIRKEGAEAFQSCVAQAPSLIEFAVDQSLQAVESGNLDEKIQSVDSILRVLQKSTNRIEQEECLRFIAERLGIAQHLLIKRYPELLRLDAQKALSGKTAGSTKPLSSGSAHVPWERALIGFLLQGQLTPSQIAELNHEAFTDKTLRTILETVRQHLDAKGQVPNPLGIEPSEWDEDCHVLVRELSLSDNHYDDQAAYITGCLDTLERKYAEVSLHRLIGQLREAEREGRAEEVHRLNALVMEYSQRKSRRTANVQVNG